MTLQRDLKATKLEVKNSISTILSKNPNLLITSAAKTSSTAPTNISVLPPVPVISGNNQRLILPKGAVQLNQLVDRGDGRLEVVTDEFVQLQQQDDNLNYDNELILSIETEDFIVQDREQIGLDVTTSEPLRKKPRILDRGGGNRNRVASRENITLWPVSVAESDISRDKVLDLQKEFSVKDLNCSICVKALDPTRLSNYRDLFVDKTDHYNSPLKDVVESLLETFPEDLVSSLLCDECSTLINKIEDLRHDLNSSCDFLVDLYQVGLRLKEEDMAEGVILSNSTFDTNGSEDDGSLCLLGSDIFTVKVLDIKESIPDFDKLEINLGCRVVDTCKTGGIEEEQPRTILYCSKEEWENGNKGGLEPSRLATKLSSAVVLSQKTVSRVVLSPSLLHLQDKSLSFICGDCPRMETRFKHLHVLVAHMQSSHPEQSDKSSFKSVHQGNNHDTVVNDDAVVWDGENNLETETTSLEKPFQCETCKKCFSNYSNMMSHVEHYHGWTRQCNVEGCTANLTSINDYVTHHVQHFDPNFSIPESNLERNSVRCVCPMCRKMSLGVNRHWEHTFIHDKVPRFKCPVCDRRVNKVQNLKDHIKRHLGPESRTKACEICNKKFCPADIYKHMKMVHGKQESKFQCSICLKSFPVLHKLKHHQEIHTDKDEWSFKCSECQTSFPSESRLDQHIKSSHQTSPVLCLDCGKSFQNKFILAAHVRNLHGEESSRFQCTCCGVKVTSLFAARKHYRLEHKDKPFSCGLCKKVFNKEGSLHAHMVKHHPKLLGENEQEEHSESAAKLEFPCVFCGKIYNKQVTRLRHLRFHHLVESLDVSNIQDEVHMVGDYVAEFSKDTGQIVALHSIP